MDRLTLDELMLYWAYWQANPWGEWRADLRIAQLCAIIANVNRDPKKRKKPYTADEFMPFDQFGRKRKRQADTGNVEPGLFDALMGLAKAVDSRASLQRAAPHLPAETLAKLTEKVQRDA
jgi:hypothetical protein